MFLNFEQPDWEAELAEFKNTDIEVPATLIVDGKTYSNVGVQFRGASSFGMVPAGSKRSSICQWITLIASTFARLQDAESAQQQRRPDVLEQCPLFADRAQASPAPKANLVKVVINGESWGIYANVQQFNKDFLAENFPTTKERVGRSRLSRRPRRLGIHRR